MSSDKEDGGASEFLHPAFFSDYVPPQANHTPIPSSGSDGSGNYPDFTCVFDSGYHTWPDREAMIKKCREVATGYNMVLTIKRSWGVGGGRLGRVLLACEQYGKKRKKPEMTNNEGGVRRHRARSKISGCPFALYGYEIHGGRWRLHVQHGIHTHTLPDSLEGHAYAGRLTETSYQEVKKLSETGTMPKPILMGFLLEDENTPTSRRHIYNARAKMRKEARGSRSVTQHILKLLSDSGYYVDARRMPGNEDVMSDLFLAHPESRHFLELFPYVVILDSTYMTNKYGMSLLEIVGFTCTGMTFNIAFAFMRNENEDSYSWALSQLMHLYDNKCPELFVTDRELGLINALENVFPNVKHTLCWVHISRKCEEAALKHTGCLIAQQEFKSDCWELFNSKTEETYEGRRRGMYGKWSATPQLMGYLDSVWLQKHKKRIIRAWTDTVHHFGTRTTNRVESSHAVLKKVLNSTIGGFDAVVKAIDLVMLDQIHALKGSLEIDRFRPLVDIQEEEIFSRLIGKVSKLCFEHLESIVNRVKAKKHEPDCSDRWWRDCYGLPCAHDIQWCLDNKTPIMPGHIHKFWKQLEWKGVDIERSDDHIPLSLADVKFREMMMKYESGQLDQDTLWRVTTAYTDASNPGASTLKEPSYEPTKGRPRKNPCGRIRSSWEKTQSDFLKAQNRRSSSGSRGRGSRGRGQSGSGSGRGRSEVSSGSVSFTGAFEENVPSQDQQPLDLIYKDFNWGHDNVDEFMMPYVSRVTDVERDGHCGYRALAEHLGIGQHAFTQIRWALAEELERNYSIYTLASLATPLDEVIYNCNYTGLEGCLPRYWMEMPVIGLAFATLYQVVVVLLSWSGPHTCLPMIASSHIESPPTKEYTLALVGNRNHFVPVWLRPGAPMPPITPEWHKFHHPSVNGFDQPFLARLQMYRNYRDRVRRPLLF